MNSRWVDILGVTVVNEQVKLPCDPNIILLTFADAVSRQAGQKGWTRNELVDEVCATTQGDARRIQGLMDWLGNTRVARWVGEEERLELFPETDVLDLVYRFIAWVGSQSVRGRVAEQSQRFVEALRTQASVEYRVKTPRAMEAEFVQTWFDGESNDSREDARDKDSEVVRGKVRGLLKAFDESFVEREHVVRSVFLSVLAGQHALLLGPPGTAKSMLARAICECFAGTTYFEYLLSRFTHPDELFGPVSIPGLKKEDYRRLTDGFLPSAHIGFLDEIFKANSAILNSLLTLVNERVFHHGRHRDDVPLLSVIGASNELPDPGSGLGALYDRFLVRLVVPPLSGTDGFLKVAMGQLPTFSPAEKDLLTLTDLAFIREEAAKVVVPESVRNALADLWRQARERDWGVSDRRWRQAISMLKVAASTDGRAQVALADLLLLEPVLAPDPSELSSVRDVLLERIRPETAPSHDLMMQWVLINGDRVAPVSGMPYSEGVSPRLSIDARLKLRTDSLNRFFALHNEAVEEQAQHREAVERFGERHLWITRTPVALLEPHIETSRHLARLLRGAEKYRDSVASLGSVALRLLQQMPEEKKATAQQFDAVAEVEGLGAFGLFNGGWRRIALPSSVPRWTLSESEFFGWLEGTISTKDLLQGSLGWTGASRLESLEKVRRAWSDLVIPSPGAPPKP